MALSKKIYFCQVHDSMSGGLKGLKSELDSRASEGLHFAKTLWELSTILMLRGYIYFLMSMILLVVQASSEHWKYSS